MITKSARIAMGYPSLKNAPVPQLLVFDKPAALQIQIWHMAVCRKQLLMRAHFDNL